MFFNVTQLARANRQARGFFLRFELVRADINADVTSASDVSVGEGVFMEEYEDSHLIDDLRDQDPVPIGLYVLPPPPTYVPLFKPAAVTGGVAPQRFEAMTLIPNPSVQA